MQDLRQKTGNTFLAGMNKDADEALLPETQYISAKNFRLVSDKDTNQTGSLSNLLGNVKSVPSDKLHTSTVWSHTLTEPIDWTTAISSITIAITAPPYGLFYFEYHGLTNDADLYHALADSISNHATLSSLFTAVANNVELLVYSTNQSFYGNLVNVLFNITSPIGYSSLTQTLVVPEYNNLKFIGWAQNREDTILISCSEDSQYSNGQIWLLTFDDTVSPTVPTLELLYNNQMNLTLDYPIRDAKCNFDSEKSQKVYFTDNHNFFRHFDYKRPDHFSTPTSNLDIIGDVVFSKPQLNALANGGYLKNGTYQYAYKLFNTFGSETLFSPTSNMIPITNSNSFGPTDHTFLGGVRGDAAGKTISIRIDNLDRRYDNIELVSLFYEDLEGTPEINVIYRGVITNNFVVIKDTGAEVLGTYSYPEFTSLGGVLFRCKTFDTKNNLMLPANITLEEFDVNYDARAYGWRLYNNAWYCRIKDRYGNAQDVSASDYSYAGTTEQVPEEHDAINPDYINYRFQNGTFNRGGSGPNVSYTFKPISLKLGHNIDGDASEFYARAELQPWNITLGNDFTSNGGGLTNYANVFNASQFVGYTRDEIYRFGIVFYSKKGMRSPVKWIGDIKFPSMNDRQHYLGDDTYSWNNGSTFKDYPTFYADFSPVYGNDMPKYALPLGIEFTINIPDDIKDLIAGYEIVRVKRESKDRRIVTQALVLPTSVGREADNVTRYIGAHGFGDPTLWNMVSHAEDWHDTNAVRLASPEICIDEDFNYGQGDAIQIIAKAQNFNYSHLNTFQDTINTINLDYATPWAVMPLKSAVKARSNDSTIPFACSEIGVSHARNIWQNADWTVCPTGRANGGTCLYTSTTVPIPLAVLSYFQNYFPLICNYIRNLVSQYGGNWYENRQNNTYISTGGFRRLTDENISAPEKSIVFGGDTYITVFDYNNMVWNFGVGISPGNDSRCQVLYMPLESHINCDYRGTKSFRKNKNQFLQEGPVNATDSSSGFSYVQDYNLYVYNPVYSNQNNGHVYITDLPLSQDIVKHDTRIYSSNRKQLGEIKDSWTKFLSANYIDINPYCGEINKVVNFKNNFYALQNNGIGVASIDDRSVVPDQTGIGVVLGTGGILTRYDYISMSIGTRHQFSVLTSDDNLYFYDSADKQIKVMGGEGTMSLTEAKGLRSYMLKNVHPLTITSDNPHRGSGISCYWDNNYGEAVYSFLYDTTGRTPEYFTISYNESAKCFVSFYDFMSPMYIRPWTKVLSLDRRPNIGDGLYQHNEGNYCEFYGTIYPSYIHILANKDYESTKVYDSIEIPFNSQSTTSNQLKDFFQKIRCYNEYQNTDWYTLTWNPPIPANKEIQFARKERSYTLSFPRNLVDQSIIINPDIFDPLNLTNTTRLYRERLRSKALHIELEYDNISNNKIYFPAIITNYRMSIR